MIRELFYKNRLGEYRLLAKEKTVQLLFKGSYIQYLKCRLEDDDVQLLRTKKYEPNITGNSLAVNPTMVVNNHDIRMMAIEEKQMSIKLGVRTIAKYQEKKSIK